MKAFPILGKFCIFTTFIFGAILVSGCGKKSTSSVGGSNIPPNSVFISGFAFNPDSRTVPVGTTITWRNDDSAPHTVTSDSGNELASPTLNRGQTYTHTFNSAGVYSYHCTLHPTMRGTITVQ